MAKILIKRSDVTGFVPATTDLSIGELQLNTTDGKLFMKRSVLAVESILEVGKDAATAIKLMTGRKINGVVFDGTQDISFGTNSVLEESNLYYTQARFDSAFGNKTTSSLFEGTNLYYTQARFDAAFGAKTTNDLTEGSNLYYTQARFNTAFAAKSTTDLTEGTNLYYTNTRASAAAPVQTVAGRTGNVVIGLSDVVNAMNKTGDTMTGFLVLNASPTLPLHATTKGYVDAQISGGTASTANKLTTARNINGTPFDGTQDISFTTDATAEGTVNKYYTQARFDSALAAKTTNDLTEGTTNKYYLDSRARAAISVTGSLAYNATTGVLSYTTPVTTVFGRTGDVVLTSSDVVTALGYTPTNSSGAGTPGGAATLDANGKLLSSQIPAIAVTDTYMAASQAEMLALSLAETGDVAIRTDLSKSFILKANPYSTLANWQELLTPVDVVQSVAGKTGTVLLAVTDVAGAAPSLSPTFTGTPTAPTPSLTDSTTLLATTAFVKGQAYATLASPALTGIPTAPTATSTDSSTQLATTAFVKAQNYATTTGSVTNAQTVTNAAQPAITSLGTLTALTVAGLTSLGNGSANYVNILGGATGTGPLITVDGTDASADLQLSGKNAGVVKVLTPMTVAGTIAATNNISSNANVSGRFVIGSVSPGLSATGTTQLTGSSVINQISVITAATAGTAQALTLAFSAVGQICYLINTTSVTISVFPQSSGTIDSLAQNAAYSLGPNTRLAFIATSTSQWYTMTGVYA